MRIGKSLGFCGINPLTDHIQFPDVGGHSAAKSILEIKSVKINIKWGNLSKYRKISSKFITRII